LVITTLTVALGACSKNKPEMIQGAMAAPAPTAPAPGKGAPAATDNDETPPTGIDVGKFDDYQRKVFFRVANRESSVCGKGHSLIYSVKHDPSCKKSFYAIRYVAKLVESGYTDSEVGEELNKRYRDSSKSTIDISQAPCKGASTPGVTIVEFADYECPHCKVAQVMMHQIVEAFPNDVKICFKHYPLPSHTNSRLAAEGAVAAQKQGKFWPYNEKIWENSDFLTPALLERIAKEVGLDVAKWRADKEADELKTRVSQDKSDGKALGITSTPTIYVNGRQFSGRHDLANLKDWVEEELGK
jgi:protein-disulfide isomerase